MLEKKCKTCNHLYSGDISQYFSFDKTRVGGFFRICKKCKREYDIKRNKDKQIKTAEKIKIERIRSSDKLKYKGTYKNCSVLECGKKAELHHITYDEESIVIPLCRIHHSKIHSINNVLIKAKDFKIQSLEQEVARLKEEKLELLQFKKMWQKASPYKVGD